MPTYDFACPNGHRCAIFETMSSHIATRVCEVCGLPSEQQYSFPPGTIGGQMTDATRKILEVPFGKRQARKMLYAKDVDSQIGNIEKKYGMFGHGIQSGMDDKGL